MNTESPKDAPLQITDANQNPAELEHLLIQHLRRLEDVEKGGNTLDAARVRLDIAEVASQLGRVGEAWTQARLAFDTFLDQESWQDAVEACEILYRTGHDSAITALINGVWLGVTYPIDPQTSIVMLHHLVDETPIETEGAAVAAAAAHYIAHLRAEDDERENLSFMTSQVLARVAKAQRNIEEPDMISMWMDMLGLNDPARLLPALGRMLDAVNGDNWWYDRDALRARLPVN
ncbi:MAG TPA: hypothetical protein ENJ05_07980 [Thiotrichales bacterium]|nr:hypothetical protein [Thiotrichales bacterium]